MRASLGCSIYRAAGGAGICRVASRHAGIQIQTQEHLVEEWIVAPGTGDFQSVEEWVVIEHIRGVQIEPAIQPGAFCADVARIQRERTGELPSDRQREVLDVRSVEVGVERCRALA